MNPVQQKSYLVKHAENLWKVFWIELGGKYSYGNMPKWCLAHNIVDPKTQNIPTKMGVWKAMWRWASQNEEKAFEIQSQSLDPMTRKEWDELIKKHSRTAWQNKKYKKAYDAN